MTVNQNSIALSSDRGSLEIAGVSLLYEGTRVKSYLLGRDLNPTGRGDGNCYVKGTFMQFALRVTPSADPIYGFGNSINNDCPKCDAGYHKEGGSCCKNTDNAADKCFDNCKKGCIAYIANRCDPPPAELLEMLRNKTSAEIRRDWTLSMAYCALLALAVACRNKPGNEGPFCCPPESDWACCKAYCLGLIGGGTAGSGGSGGSGGGGGGNLGTGMPTVNFINCAPAEENALRATLNDLFSCLKSCTSTECIFLYNCLKNMSTLNLRCRKPNVTNCCWGKIDDRCTACATIRKVNPTWALSCSAECDCRTFKKGIQYDHILLCDRFFAGDQNREGEGYNYFWCDKIDTIVHELLHLCNKELLHNKVVEYSRKITTQCFCECKRRVVQ